MNNKSTPRTNAAWQKHKCLSPQSAADAYELSQQLERELYEARKEIERLKQQTKPTE